MNIYIPDDLKLNIPDRELFILTRPFRAHGRWQNDNDLRVRWGIDGSDIFYSNDIHKASVILLPYTINDYIASNNKNALRQYSELCQKWGIKAYGFLSGDWGVAYPEYKGITYFRTGGFRSQLSAHNQGFPVSLSDHHKRLYGADEIEIRRKEELPTIGFCGHASLSVVKCVKESSKFLIENVVRAFRNPTRSDWEPVFPSAWYRAALLRILERSSVIRTNFIFRKHYRAGANTDTERDKTTREYYDNIRNSDYVLCIRGGGNFSVRLYETLMMGRVPVFVNTDCLMPFPEKIDWSQHVVWVEWRDRHKLHEAVAQHYAKLDQKQFSELQVKNRVLWKEVLSVKGIFSLIN